jgi:sulfur relay (sulfurtransferase) DsrF/TusC family protein
MSFNLFIIKSPSYMGRSHLETLEALMSIGLFEIEHRVVFFESGISWLLTGQKPEHEKSIEKQLNALPMYGIEHLHYVTEQAQSQYSGQLLNKNATPISEDDLISWMCEAQHIEVLG